MWVSKEITRGPTHQLAFQSAQHVSLGVQRGVIILVEDPNTGGGGHFVGRGVTGLLGDYSLEFLVCSVGVRIRRVCQRLRDGPGLQRRQCRARSYSGAR